MTVICRWCGEAVEAKPVQLTMSSDRYLRLRPHEDIYPQRACEGGNRVFDTWDRRFLDREKAVQP